MTFVCRRCGDCCHAFKLLGVSVFEAAKLNPKKTEKISRSKFRIKKVKNYWTPKWFRAGACSFLRQNSGCSVYENRPSFCKKFQCDGASFVDLVSAVASSIYHDHGLTSEQKKEIFIDFLKSRHELKRKRPK